MSGTFANSLNKENYSSTCLKDPLQQGIKQVPPSSSSRNIDETKVQVNQHQNIIS